MLEWHRRGSALSHVRPARLRGRRLHQPPQHSLRQAACGSSPSTTRSNRPRAPRSTCSARPRHTTRCRGSGRINTISSSSSWASARATMKSSCAARRPPEAFRACYLRDGELVAIDTVNAPKDQMAARKLVAARARPDPRQARGTVDSPQGLSLAGNSAAAALDQSLRSVTGTQAGAAGVRYTGTFGFRGFRTSNAERRPALQPCRTDWRTRAQRSRGRRTRKRDSACSTTNPCK